MMPGASLAILFTRAYWTRKLHICDMAAMASALIFAPIDDTDEKIRERVQRFKRSRAALRGWATRRLRNRLDP